MSEIVLAAIQAAPVHFDRDASTEKACRLIAAAADKGATLAAFGECWLPGYPAFAFAPPTLTRWRAGAAYIAAADEVPGPEIARVCAAARKAKIDVAIGVGIQRLGAVCNHRGERALEFFGGSRLRGE